ncbi:MAG: COX15/CtaA family protein [Roseovarius sp.]|nr:COX15/CtaA family protein [Roseovarius sp.]
MNGKRNIFQEVGGDFNKNRKSEGGIIDSGRRRAQKLIRIWLMTLLFLVVLMIVIGGLTRLTDSGLSITEWNPVTGALPPMNANGWQVEFEKYRRIPEYNLQNKGMSLDEFKVIFWWEWGHRQLGRFIGLVWAAGFVGFLAFGKIPPGWTGRLLIPGILGGVQGLIGWWMVKSGLTGEMLDVASYRLAVHLGLAFVIAGLLFWYIMALSRESLDLVQAHRYREKNLSIMSVGWLHLVFAQILIGALVAGIDAGRTYTDWPLMAGGIFPPEIWDENLGWRNLFENPGLVQFVHRVIGYFILIYALAAWSYGRKSSNRKTAAAFNMAFIILIVQIVLGIVTVLHVAPWYLAIMHQIIAILLWLSILRTRFLSNFPVFQKIDRM